MEYRLGRMEDIDAICLLISAAIKEMESKEIYQWDELEKELLLKLPGTGCFCFL